MVETFDECPGVSLRTDIGGVLPTFATPALLTTEGRTHLAARCDQLRAELVDLAPLLQEGERDERHVREYERLLGEVSALEAELAAAADLEARRRKDSLAGRRVQIVTDTGEKIVVRAVHPLEAPVDDERISWDSPLGRVLVNASVGDELTVESPRGSWTCRVGRVLD